MEWKLNNQSKANNCPRRNLDQREDLRRDLNEQPGHDPVGDRNFVNIAPLELGEEVFQVHGFFW